jgi:hypothetical protein
MGPFLRRLPGLIRPGNHARINQNTVDHGRRCQN